MKYLCLVYIEETALNAMPKSEFKAFSDEHVALDEELEKSDHSIAAEALQPVHTATTVRVRNGRLLVTDGPFAETKEQLLGIYLINAGSIALGLVVPISSSLPAAVSPAGASGYPRMSRFELALILALVVTWSEPEIRSWLLVGLVSHATMRVWSAFDFIPKALAFAPIRSGSPKMMPRAGDAAKPLAPAVGGLTSMAMLAAFPGAARLA